MRSKTSIELTEEEFTTRVRKIVEAVAGLSIRDVLQVLSASSLIVAKLVAEEGKCPCNSPNCIFTGDMVSIVDRYVEQHLIPDLEKVVKAPSFIPPVHTRPYKNNIH